MQILPNRLHLQRVIGTGFGSNHILWRLETAEIVYIVNNVVVFYNPRLNCQTRLIQRPSPVCSISLDRQGQYLAVSEPGAITIHDLSDEPERCRVCTFSSVIDDDYVAVRLFSDSSTLLVVSAAKSCNVRIWDWRSGQLLGSATSSYCIVSIDVALDHRSFVTCGDKSVSIWRYNKTDAEYAIKETMLKTTAATNAGLLDDTFFVVACLGKGRSSSHVFALTSKAVLCRFSLERKTLEKWVDLKLDSGLDIALTDDLIAIAGSAGRVRLFTPDTITHITTISSDCITADALSIAFNRDHSKIACLYSNYTLAIWDAKRPRLERQLGFHSGLVFDVISFTNGDAVSCCSDGQVRKWSDTSDDLIFVFEPGTYPTAITKSSNESQVVIGDCKGTLRQWHRNLTSGELTLLSTIVSAHHGRVLSIDFNLDATLLCSGGHDESIRVFDVMSELAPVGTFMDHRSPIETVRFASASEYLVSASSDGTYIRDVSSFSSEPPHLLPELVAPFVTGLKRSRFGISMDRAGRAVIWNVATREILRCVCEDVQDIAIHPCGTLIAFSRSDSQTAIMDWFSCDILATICNASSNIKIRFADDGHRLFSFGDDSCILVWQMGDELSELVDERSQELAADQRALVPTSASAFVEDYFSGESFIEFSEDECSVGVQSLAIANAPGKDDQTNDEADLRAESPPNVDLSPTRTPKGRTCWRTSERSISPEPSRTLIQKRLRSMSPSSKAKTIDGVVSDLKSAFNGAREAYEDMIETGDDAQPLMNLFETIRTQIALIIGSDQPNSVGLSAHSATLDAESTKSALDIYSGKLIELIQSKVEEVVTASISSRFR